MLAYSVQATSELFFCSQPQNLGLCHGNQSVREEHRPGMTGLNIHGGLGTLLPSPLAPRSIADHERISDWGRPLAWSGQSFFVSAGPQDLNLNSVLRFPPVPLSPLSPPTTPRQHPLTECLQVRTKFSSSCLMAFYRSGRYTESSRTFLWERGPWLFKRSC